MSIIKSMTASVCSILAVYGCLSVIRPQGGMNKPFKRVMALIIICTLIAPISKIFALKIDYKKFSADGNKEDISSQYEFDELYTRAANEAIEKEIDALLKKSGIEDYKLSVYTDISEDGGISLERVLVSCDGADKEKISCILENAGIAAEFIGN